MFVPWFQVNKLYHSINRFWFLYPSIDFIKPSFPTGTLDQSKATHLANFYNVLFIAPNVTFVCLNPQNTKINILTPDRLGWIFVPPNLHSVNEFYQIP